MLSRGYLISDSGRPYTQGRESQKHIGVSVKMANEESVDKPARLPRGVKPVAKAFFTALDTIPDATRNAVAKAAQVMIRDQLKQRRDKLREAVLKEKERARRPTAAKPRDREKRARQKQIPAAPPKPSAARASPRTQAPPPN